MLEALSDIIINLLPRMKDHYESLPGKYYEQISVQEILYALAGYIMNFDSPKDYIDEAIQQIKTTYNIA